ncbi:hypothetical protein PR003_g16374 [Phytophthora rubi]|uniref:Uncharacterized protein n=1 Tax=Phytophthora rubi TaxID=129364 RepID=A0A6A3L417_9STRA|nr:hypothetical protein PR002_g16078 [Phytophthora rubi]KAE9012638.1 hypothetical protein PR001_g15604 [Phytophthora rubi]KAE9325840.1 hypothetical protein PR003_g16374 [Phytophthora rubi]
MGRSKTKKKNGAGAKLSDGKGLATRLEEVESRSSQILRAQAPAQQGDVLLKDVLRGNGEKHLYDKILKLAVHADDDPPLIFGWKFVHEFVQAIHDANNQAAGGGAAVPPCPFPLPDPLTRESFKEALLNYARIGRADPLGTTCLPCSAPEFSRAATRLGYLSLHPWTLHIVGVGGAGNVLPVANVYVPKARTDTLKPAVDPIPNDVVGNDLWNSEEEPCVSDSKRIALLYDRGYQRED